jgi:TRAP-type C4-dicarboxylate transport system substrate-binding protein
MRKTLSLLAIFLFLMLLTLGVQTQSAFAQKKEFVLNFNHLFPEVSWMHQDVVIPWKKMVEEKSNGRIKVNLYPAAALAKPGQMYDALKSGTIDVCLEPGPYYWGRFPISEATQLPFLGANSSISATQAWMDLYKKYPQLQKEYAETHLLWLFGQGPGQLFTNRPIKVMEDMKGLIVRGPGAQGDFVKAVGGSPVSMPASESYIALSKKTIDATTFAAEALRTWRLYEVTKYAIIGDFYVQWFFVSMNKAKYESLPKDLQLVIDDCSGMTGATLTAKAWDAADKDAYDLAKQNGMIFMDVDAQELAKWESACQPLTQSWIQKMTKTGFPAEEFINDAKELLKKYNKDYVK